MMVAQCLMLYAKAAGMSHWQTKDWTLTLSTEAATTLSTCGIAMIGIVVAG